MTSQLYGRKVFEKTNPSVKYTFLQFRDFLDSSDGLTYLQIIAEREDGSITTFSYTDVSFVNKNNQYYGAEDLIN